MFPHGFATSKRGASPSKSVQGTPVLDQKAIGTLTTVGAGTILASSLSGGILRRTGPTAGYTDTFDSANNFIAAMDDPAPGDSFGFTIINGVAQAMTAAAGEGIVLGTNVDIAASVVRDYLATVLNATPRTTFSADTATSTTISNVPASAFALLTIGMGLSGTGVAAASYIVAMNEVAQTLTLSAATTATATGIAMAAFPRINISGIGARTA